MLYLHYTHRQPCTLNMGHSPAGQAQQLWESMVKTPQTSGRAPSPEHQGIALSWTREKHRAQVTPTPPPGVPGCQVEWGRNVPVKRVSEETFLP